MATLRVYLFGGLRVYHGEDLLPPFPTQKTRSLFAYLVTFRERGNPRDLLAGTFWGDVPIAQARRSLNTTLWRLRRTLPSGYIQAQGDSIAFAPTADWWLDIAEFEEGLQRAGLHGNGFSLSRPLSPDGLELLQRAVGLYRGDLLEGLDEAWSLIEAERLRSLYLRALQALLAGHRAGGRPEQALACALRLLEMDPLREDVHYQAMELYACLGRPAEAMAQFERCRQTLQEELHISPQPETRALYQRIRADGGATRPARPLPMPLPPPPLPRSPFDDLGRIPLIGREAESAALQARLEAAGRGRGGMTLVLGETGVGKSRLLQEAADYADVRGWLVLRGRCLDLGEPPPYQGWTQTLRPALFSLGRHALGRISRPWLAELAVLLPDLRRIFPDLPAPAPTPPPQRQEQLQQALERLLVSLAQERPLLLLMEDLHWADNATLEALGVVVPHLRERPILVLASARTEEIGSRLQKVCRGMEQQEGWQRLFLDRLSAEHTARLVSVVLGWPLPSPRFVHRLYQETQGNPLFLLELLKGLFEEGLLTRDRSGQWRVAGKDGPEEADWPLPRGIRQVVLRRLARMDDRSRELLALASVVGSAVDTQFLRQLCGWSEEAFLEASDELLRRQLLFEVGEQFHFAHEQIRQFVYRSIDPIRRRDLHRLAGRILEEHAPERVEELAWHFSRGQQPGKALPYCLQAGERAYNVCASAPALTYFGQAISAARRLGRAAARPALIWAHERRGQLLEHQGEYGPAAAEYAAMLALAREAGDAAAVARAIRYSGWLHGYRQEQWALGLGEARRAYEVAAVAGHPLEQAAALRDIGAYECMQGNHQASVEAYRRALLLAREAGDVAEEANILQYIAVGHLFMSQDQEALETFQQALAIRERLGDLRTAAKVRANIGLLQINRGEFAAAERSLREAEAGFRETGDLPALPLTWIGLATVLRYRGECAASLPLLDAAAEVQAGVGSSAYMDALIHLHRGAALWDLGHLGRGFAAVRTSVDLARRSGTPTLVVGCLRVLGRLLRAAGACEQALSCHQQAVALAEQVSFGRGRVENLVGAGLDMLARGRATAARPHLVEAVALSRSHGPEMHAEALAALAGLCLDEWRLEPARALAARAWALAEQMELRFLQVQALLLLGRALAGLERLSEAETALRRALELADPPGYPLVRWEVLLDLAHLMSEAGRPDEADRFREQARAVAETVLVGLEPPLGEAFRRRPAVRTLLGEAEGPLLPGQARALLARLGTPTGRPLRPGEQVAVIWSAAPVLQGPGKVAARRAHLLRLLSEARAQGGDPSEEDLAQALGVSARTVRSDVAALRAAGRPVRTRGTRMG